MTFSYEESNDENNLEKFPEVQLKCSHFRPAVSSVGGEMVGKYEGALLP